MDRADGPRAPGDPGLHVGFRARDRSQVDAFWQAGIDAGYRDAGAPGDQVIPPDAERQFGRGLWVLVGNDGCGYQTPSR